MTAKMRIALDIDGVICNFASVLVFELSQRYSITLTEKDLVTLRTNEILGITKNECKTLEKHIFFNNDTEPVDGSVEAIMALSEYFDLYIVSARIESMLPKTMQWLNKQQIPYTQIIFTAKNEKVNAIRKIAPQIWIEDDHELLIESNQKMCKILFNQPWNVLCKDVEHRLLRMNSWPEIVDYCKQIYNRRKIK